MKSTVIMNEICDMCHKYGIVELHFKEDIPFYVAICDFLSWNAVKVFEENGRKYYDYKGVRFFLWSV